MVLVKDFKNFFAINPGTRTKVTTKGIKKN